MEILTSTLRHTWNWTLRLSLFLTLLCALLLLLARLLLPQLANHRPAVEQLLDSYLHARVHIEDLEAAWQGWKPLLRLRGFSLGDPRRDVPPLSFQEAWVTVDVLRSALSGRLVLSNIRLEGVHLTVEKTANEGLQLLMQASNTSPAKLQDLAAWLFDINSLDLPSAQLQLRDTEGKISSLLIQDVDLSLRSKANGWRLDLAAKLPESLGRKLSAIVELHGRAEDPRGWKVAFYAQGEDLTLSGWQLPMGYPSSKADLSIWGDWQGQGQIDLLGKVSLQNPALPSSPSAQKQPTFLAGLPNFTVDFNWRQDAQGWRWQSHWTGLKNTNEPVFSTAMDLSMTTSPDEQLQYLQGHTRNLRFQDLAALVSSWLNESQRDMLIALLPTGEIPEMSLRATFQDEPSPSLNSLPLNRGSNTRAVNSPSEPLLGSLRRKLKAFDLAVRFTGFSIRSHDYLPGVNGLAGSLALTQDGGQLNLDSQTLTVEATPFVPKPVILDSLKGSIAWHYQDSTGIVFESPGLRFVNRALNANLAGSLTLFNDTTSPKLDLRLDYHNLDVSQVRHYLPSAIMPAKLVNWLDRALVSGHIPFGDLRFQGHIADFPFDKGQGLFETRFQVQDTILDYFAEWPRIEELEAEVSFHNRSFQLTAVAGKILDGDLQKIDARIANLAHGVLEIRGLSRQSTASLLHFLNVSPLAKKVGDSITGMKTQGDTILNLQLSIPLDPRPNQVKGTVDFVDASLTQADWDLEFIRLAFQGEPMHLDIHTRRLNDHRETRFSLRGNLSGAALVDDLSPGLASLINGRSLWEATLTVPHTVPGTPALFALELTSDLKGTAIKLPHPFGKSATENRLFRAQIRPTALGDTRQLKLDYGPDIKAIAELSGTHHQLRLNRGELRIAAGEAKLPNNPGLVVTAYLPQWELSKLSLGKSAASFPPWLSTLEIHLDELLIGKQSFKKVSLTGKNNKQTALAIRFQSESLAGQLSIPAEPSTTEPITLELQRLSLQTDNQPERTANQQGNLDPRLLLPLRMAVQDLQLDGYSLGKLRLITVPQERGLRLAELQLQSELFQINASGDWKVTREGQATRLEVRLHSPDLGRTLLAFGYSAALERGKTEAKLTANWPASLLQFSPLLVNGSLNLQIGRGQLPNVPPGVGRVFGLFNLSSLSRRLTLDFSDLFRQGLGFDRIDGDFTFNDGNAYTDNLTLKGPSAHIHIKGRVGLKDRDYDQIITVAPQMGSSLALASTIAGGPVIGAAVFIAENLFKRQIERAASYQYTMTGSWDDPMIARKTPSATSVMPSGNPDR
jgi:uncharacterized protein (TIGR02099 family)